MGYHPPNVNSRRKGVHNGKKQRVSKRVAKMTGAIVAPKTRTVRLTPVSRAVTSTRRARMLERRARHERDDAVRELEAAGVSRDELAGLMVDVEVGGLSKRKARAAAAEAANAAAATAPRSAAFDAAMEDVPGM